MKIDPRIESEQVERLRAKQWRGDGGLHAAALETVDRAPRSRDNFLPRVLEAEDAYVTVAIANVLRAAGGEYRETLTV